MSEPTNIDSPFNACMYRGHCRRIQRSLEKLQIELAAQREQVAQWMFSVGFATGHGDTVADLLKEATWQLAELRAERDALKADAERYRWLRRYQGKFTKIWREWLNCEGSYIDLDATIDSAREQQPAWR